jgi:hypothetical protein
MSGDLLERSRAYRAMCRDLIAALGAGRGVLCERRLRRAASALRAALVDGEPGAWTRGWHAVREVVRHAAGEVAARTRLEAFLHENADLARSGSAA